MKIELPIGHAGLYLFLTDPHGAFLSLKIFMIRFYYLFTIIMFHHSLSLYSLFIFLLIYAIMIEMCSLRSKLFVF